MMILVIIICYFAGLLLIAHITGHKGGSNAAFFKGENKSPWYIVSFGMIGATISGVTFVSVPGMVRGMDMTYMQTVFGFFFGYMIVAHILLPLYYRLNLTSIYGYLGTRIGVNAYRTGSFFFLLSRMLGTAAKLYLVCLILHTHVFQDMHIPFWVIAVGSVALVWIYTHKSGIKTIVWTDTLQTFCLIAALLFIIYFTIQKLDIGFDGIVQTIRHSEHSRIFVFDDWMSRQNFFKQFFSGIFIVIVMTGLDQDMMQKNLSCMQLDAPPVVLRRGEPQVGFGVDLKPQPQPLGHRVFSSPGHVQAAGLPNGLLQLRLDLGLGSAQYVLDDPLAGIRVVSGGVPALPAAIAALANISLTIGPLFGHVVRLPCSNTTYSRKEKISRANQQS